MSENARERALRIWHEFVMSGDFADIEHPKEGYSIGDTVVSVDGRFFPIKGFGSDGRVIVALDENPNGKEITLKIDDIRPSGDVGQSMILGENVKSPDKAIGIDPPQKNKFKKN